MSHTAINVSRLGKKYRIGEFDSAFAWNPLSALLSRTRGKRQEDKNIIWALRDVSFDIESGDTVGIIGPNGAGKSTLLKVLTRITHPTEGEVRIRGRVGALLEVGTGFQPMLTGRENMYLSGAILGMKKAEVDRKFDEIVAFSGVEKFIDTPVRHYSSGMYLRLAFAVSAHLEPDVLLVDEVLAVGDAEFQRKCLGKLDNVANEGRTVLFVSHNMAAIQHLCRRVMLFRGGTCVADGPPDEVIPQYFKQDGEITSSDLTHFPRPARSLKSILRSITLEDAAGNPARSFPAGEAVSFRIGYQADEPIKDPRFGIIISSMMGVPLFFLQTELQHGIIKQIEAEGDVICRVPSLPLMPGTYRITLGCSTTKDVQLDLVENCAEFDVLAADYFHTGRLPPTTSRHGHFLVNAQWDIPSQLE